MLEKAKRKFPFKKDDVVLAKYGQELYYAKILMINYKRKFAKLLFDDGSKEEVNFRKIFSVNEETSDIICIICKTDKTESQNDIVLCDHCNVGYHQCCHEPNISSDVLLPEVPWECVYCQDHTINPYVSENPFEEKESEESEESEVVPECPFVEEESNEDKTENNEILTTTYKVKSNIEMNEIEMQKMKICDDSEYMMDYNNNNVKEVKNTNKEFEIIDEKIEEDCKAIGNEAVVIAHADSTSNEDYIDVVNGCDDEPSMTLLPKCGQNKMPLMKVEDSKLVHGEHLILIHSKKAMNSENEQFQSTKHNEQPESQYFRHKTFSSHPAFSSTVNDPALVFNNTIAESFRQSPNSTNNTYCHGYELAEDVYCPKTLGVIKPHSRQQLHQHQHLHPRHRPGHVSPDSSSVLHKVTDCNATKTLKVEENHPTVQRKVTLSEPSEPGMYHQNSVKQYYDDSCYHKNHESLNKGKNSEGLYEKSKFVLSRTPSSSMLEQRKIMTWKLQNRKLQSMQPSQKGCLVSANNRERKDSVEIMSDSIFDRKEHHVYDVNTVNLHDDGRFPYQSTTGKSTNSFHPHNKELMNSSSESIYWERRSSETQLPSPVESVEFLSSPTEHVFKSRDRMIVEDQKHHYQTFDRRAYYVKTGSQIYRPHTKFHDWLPRTPEETEYYDYEIKGRHSISPPARWTTETYDSMYTNVSNRSRIHSHPVSECNRELNKRSLKRTISEPYDRHVTKRSKTFRVVDIPIQRRDDIMKKHRCQSLNSFPKTQFHSDPFNKDTHSPPIGKQERQERHENMKKEHVCYKCNNPAELLCSACHEAWYCSPKCQLSHWDLHSKICGKKMY